MTRKISITINPQDGSFLDDPKPPQIIELSTGAFEVLCNLIFNGPVWDGDVISKSGRDELLDKGLAVKVIANPNGKHPEYGFQAATYKGGRVFQIYYGTGTYTWSEAVAKYKQEKGK